MYRFVFLVCTLVMGGAFGQASKCFANEVDAHKQPNIVLIMADDLGTETIGCYGAKDYRTPNIDALAASGVRFRHCYSQPLCTPSRAQIMTGRYNHRNYQGFGYLDPQEVTFGNVLKKAGYQTCIAGKWQLCGDASTLRNFGFDEHCLWNMHAYRKDAPNANEPKGWLRRYDAATLYENGKWNEYPAGVYGPQVCADFISSFIARKKDRPFFVYYPMILTHGPFVPSPASDDPNSKNRKQNFVDMVEYMDFLVGQIVQQLDKQGVLENTLILFTGDNGTDTSITSDTLEGRVRGRKGSMADGGTHVPLVATWSGESPAGKVVDDLVDFSDFLPTLCDATGASLPADRIIDGQTFFPQILGKKGEPREWLFCHYWGGTGRKREGTREFVRNQRWKLYDDGQMFDVMHDPEETKPLEQLDPEVVIVKQRFREVFESLKSNR